MALFCPGLVGSFGVLAGELFVREYFLDGDPLFKNGGLWERSSSDFFLPFLVNGASKELDLEGGFVYKLDVDFAFVRPPERGLVPNLREPPEPGLPSNNFLVCFTISGAGSSLSLTPNKTPDEARLDCAKLFAFECCLVLALALFEACCGLNGLGCVDSNTLGGGCFSAMMISAARAGWDKVLWTLGLSLQKRDE